MLFEADFKEAVPGGEERKVFEKHESEYPELTRM